MKKLATSFLLPYKLATLNEDKKESDKAAIGAGEAGWPGPGDPEVRAPGEPALRRKRAHVHHDLIG